MAIRIQGLSKIRARAEYEPYMRNIVSCFGNRKYFLGGSFSRNAKTSGDLDYLVEINSEADRADIHASLQSMGWKLISKKHYMGHYVIINEDDAVEVDVFFSRPETWGTAQLFITGSKYWNNFIRDIVLKSMKMDWNDVLWFNDKESGAKISFPTEKETLDFLGMRYEKPENRVRETIVFNLKNEEAGKI